jgi:mannose-6-phosphate isomerase
MKTMQLVAAIDRLDSWYKASVLPLWARTNIAADGLFYEALDHAAAPITGRPRRVRVQSRQIHTFTMAARAGQLPAGETIAQTAFAKFVTACCPDHGLRGCAHLIADRTEILDATRDLYDQAFLLLACAARIAAGDAAAASLADRTLRFLNDELASPHGGYFENDKGSLPRRQNPHMHLFEALLALYEATGKSEFLERARAIESLAMTRFIDRKAGIVREFFAQDWTLDAVRGDTIEPGHMMEWAHLLNRFQTLTGEDRRADIVMLYRSAKKFALPGGDGFLPTCCALNAASGSSRRRLWPQTEHLRAAFAIGGEGDDDAVRLIAGLFRTYFNQRVDGLWCDEYDGDGAPVAADVPASMLYHVHEAVADAVRRRNSLLAPRG